MTKLYQPIASFFAVLSMIIVDTVIIFLSSRRKSVKRNYLKDDKDNFMILGFHFAKRLDRGKSAVHIPVSTILPVFLFSSIN